MENDDRTTIKLIFSGIIGVGVIIVFLMAYYTVDQYERAVLTRFGKIVQVSDPGLHFKLPFMHSVHTYRTDILNVFPKKAVNTYTIDNQEIDIVFTVFYRIPVDKVAYVYENVQDLQYNLLYMAEDRLKAEMGNVNVQHVAEQRGAIRDKIKGVLALASANLGVEITDFQLNNLEYTKSFRSAVESAAAAKAMVETREQERIQAIKVAEKITVAAVGEANAQRERAKGNADATLLNAEADAKAIRLRGEAEAKAIQAQADALRANPHLVELRKAEKWDGALPTQMLSGVVPFMQFKAPGEK